LDAGAVASSRFRALEYFCVLFDIAVDQEDYSPEWFFIRGHEAERHLTVAESEGRLPPWQRRKFDLSCPDSIFGDEPSLEIILTPGAGPLRSLLSSRILQPLREDGRVSGCGDEQIDSYWRKLLVAKFCRARLQEWAATAAESALDQVGLALLRTSPMPDTSATGSSADALRVLRWMYLNEASACYVADRSITIADDCLAYIEREAGRGRSPHELVALYNKAQGHLHVQNLEEAFEHFVRVFKWTTGDKDAYFAPGDGNPFAWRSCKTLFSVYLAVPSVLQAADTLLKLQTSTDAGHVLHFLRRRRCTEYQRARRIILEARIENDVADKRLPEFTCPEQGSSKRNIKLQCLAVVTDRHLKNAERAARNVCSERQGG
jgi:hypothetical protein